MTNPEAHSVPEELLLSRDTDGYTVLAFSNLVDRGKLLMSDAQIDQLRRHLKVIHDHFERLYNPAVGEPFAMEIEFKITRDNILAIKQARPWVFSATSPPPPTPPRLAVVPVVAAVAGARAKRCPTPLRICWRTAGGCGGDADVGRAGGRRRLRDHGITNTGSTGEEGGSPSVPPTPPIRSPVSSTARPMSSRCGR